MVTAAGKFLFSGGSLNIEFIQSHAHGQTLTYTNISTNTPQPGDLLITMYAGSGSATISNTSGGATEMGQVNSSYTVASWFKVVENETFLQWNKPHSFDDWITHQYRPLNGGLYGATLDYSFEVTSDDPTNLNQNASKGPCIRAFASRNDGSSTNNNSVMDFYFGNEGGVLRAQSGIDLDGIGNLYLNQSGTYPSAGGIIVF